MYSDESILGNRSLGQPQRDTVYNGTLDSYFGNSNTSNILSNKKQRTYTGINPSNNTNTSHYLDEESLLRPKTSFIGKNNPLSAKLEIDMV